MPTIYRCPNCGLETNYYAEICPKCGASKTLKFVKEIQQERDIQEAKKKRELATPRNKLEVDLCFAGTEQDLRNGILKSLRDVERQESETGWGKIVVRMTGDTPEWMTVKLLKAIVDQNKVIMRQNELLLRTLKNKKQI